MHGSTAGKRKKNDNLHYSQKVQNQASLTFDHEIATEKKRKAVRTLSSLPVSSHSTSVEFLDETNTT